jgi:hypothetical protein
MTPERFKQLADSYGGDLLRWPVSLQGDARDCLAENSYLRELLQQAAQLDQTLDSWAAPGFAGLEVRLLQQHLPDRQRSLIDWVAAWLFPLSGMDHVSWRRWAALACLPLLMGLLTGGQFELNNAGLGLPFESSLEQSPELSLEEELYFISLSDYAENL